MLRQIFAIMLKDLKILFRDARGLVTLFLMPFMFMLILTVALSGALSNGGSNAPIPVLVVNDDQGDLANKAILDLKTVARIKIEDTWEGQVITRQIAEGLIRNGKRQITILFPVDFSEQIQKHATDKNALATTVTFIVDPAAGLQLLGPVQGSVQGFILRV